MWSSIRRGHQLIARVTPTAAVAVAGSRCSSNVAVAAAAMQHRRQSAAAAASQAVCFLPPSPLSLFPTTFATDSAAAAAEETAEEAVPCDLLAGLDIQAHVVKASRGGKPAKIGALSSCCNSSRAFRKYIHLELLFYTILSLGCIA